VFSTKAGVHYWEQVRAKLVSIFKHIFALQRANRVRHEGLLAVLAGVPGELQQEELGDTALRPHLPLRASTQP
jgi:hypothetical protein